MHAREFANCAFCRPLNHENQHQLYLNRNVPYGSIEKAWKRAMQRVDRATFQLPFVQVSCKCVKYCIKCCKFTQPSLLSCVINVKMKKVEAIFAVFQNFKITGHYQNTYNLHTRLNMQRIQPDLLTKQVGFINHVKSLAT